MRCPACGGENPDGKRFCGDCGRSLATVCPACATPVEPGKRFCGDCGTPVEAATPAPEASTVAPDTTPSSGSVASELRHVSVLFCDLVGFTPFTEKRDPEEVRGVLSGYFELARNIIGRYGGVVEKFIGDAVMAVWGAPVANEDDAERAVRAGLELVSAVSAYGSANGTDLQARVGIVTGGAITSEKAGEGLVVGDRVNTAARIQSVAPPGCCYVDEVTRAATTAAIAYADAGEHDLKGKAEPVRIFQATRVIATVGGSERSAGIEAPFVGRDHELHFVKELFHATADRRSARLVLVSGVAGVGKSRLSWEFEKYIDGLAGTVLWHAGQCLSYGEGISYWALSQMVRARLQIGEKDPQELVADRLRTGLERWISDLADREFIAPRLGQLLGLPAERALAREELFAGWRLFFERLAEHLPVVMVVEDLQWADAGILDFLDHLLEWSGDHCIFLLVLSRPDGTERHGLGLSRRSVTTLPLDPLPDQAMGELLDGLVEGLPAAARSRIVERADGIPLYAIETVRGLLDKGVVAKSEDGTLRLVGELGELEIPPGLTALISSRLDGLGPDERRLVKECSVLGTSFPRHTIEAVTDLEQSLLEDLLSSLVRKEVLTVRADRHSPDRGQYVFTQSLIRSVAYELLTRAERKAWHLRTAEHLRAAFPDEGAEVAEVIAAHLYDAYLAAQDDPDAYELHALAKDAYRRAGERAESVGALEAAEAAYLRAAELSSDETEQAGFSYEAGRMAYDVARFERALGHFEIAGAAHARHGRIVDAAQVTARLSRTLDRLGQGEQAITRIRQALVSLEGVTAPPEVVADLQSSLAMALAFSGHAEEARGPIEQALTLAEHHKLVEPLVRSLLSKAFCLQGAGRAEEALMLFQGVVAFAHRNGMARGELVAESDLADVCMSRDLPAAEEHARAAVTLARRWGQRKHEAVAASNLIYILTMAGRLEEALEFGTELLATAGDGRGGIVYVHHALISLSALRGDREAARQHLTGCQSWLESDDVQDRAEYAAGEATVLLIEGDSRHALEAAHRSIDEAMRGGLGIANGAVRLAVPLAFDAAIEVGDLDEADRLSELLEALPAGEVPPFLRAQVTRSKALVAGVRGEKETVESNLVAAEAAFRDLGYPYWTARAQLERADWIARQDRPAESARLATEAASTLAEMGASTMLARARSLLESPAVRSGDATAAEGTELQVTS